MCQRAVARALYPHGCYSLAKRVGKVLRRIFVKVAKTDEIFGEDEYAYTLGILIAALYKYSVFKSCRPQMILCGYGITRSQKYGVSDLSSIAAADKVVKPREEGYGCAVI